MPFISERRAAFLEQRGHEVDVTYSRHGWPRYYVHEEEPRSTFTCFQCGETKPIEDVGFLSRSDGEWMCWDCNNALVERLKEQNRHCFKCGVEGEFKRGRYRVGGYRPTCEDCLKTEVDGWIPVEVA